MTERHIIGYVLIALIVMAGAYALVRWRRGVAREKARRRSTKNHLKRID